MHDGRLADRLDRIHDHRSGEADGCAAGFGVARPCGGEASRHQRGEAQSHEPPLPNAHDLFLLTR